MPTLEQLRQRAEKKKREAARIEQQISKQARNEDTRRKVITGATAMDLCEQDERFKRALQEHLDKYVTRDRDRELLGLPVKK